MIGIEVVANSVLLMDKQLREDLFVRDSRIETKKLWENTYIRKQLDKRSRNSVFTVSDHIRGMVYSMLTSGAAWNRLEPYIDACSGQIPVIDEIFCQYDAVDLQNADPMSIVSQIKEHKLGTQFLTKQVKALVSVNIGKLISLEKEYGSVDNFYRIFLSKDDNLKALVRELSLEGKQHKFAQLGEALTAEYLKNVGYDIGKPDRHIRRILGSEYLGCSKHKNSLPYESIDIISAISKSLNKPAAEVDYILWAYCAKGFGEVCTKKRPKCYRCVANKICINFKEE